jgi:HEAT repeat protein
VVESETRVAPQGSAPTAPIAPPIAADPDLHVLALEAVHGQLSDPSKRVPALLEIGRRRDPSSVNPVFSLLDTLPPEHVIYAVACLALFGERAAEALIAGLGSPQAVVRQACAIALGKLKLRRGLAPLLEQLETEPSPAWQELARALGDFGLAALRALARGIHNSQRRERLMVALAHLANHGCNQDLENMERDPDAVLALAARQALARRSRLHWEDEAVRRGGTLKDATPEARLSQALYATLEHVGLTTG